MAVTMSYQCPHCNTPVDVDPAITDETLTCPNEACGKPFKTEVLSAQPVPEALLPNGEKLPDSPAMLAMPATPAAAIESDLQVIELAMFRRYPARCLVFGALILAGLAGLIFSLIRAWPVLTIASSIVIVVAGYRVVVWWLRNQNTHLRITNRRVILENGVFAKESVEVPRGDIADIRVQQSMLGRLMQVGDIVIHTQGGESRRIIQVMAVPDPEGVARLIRDRAV